MRFVPPDTFQRLANTFRVFSFINKVDVNVSNGPQNNTAYREFMQVYDSGDGGSPCVGNSKRITTVNVYCGRNTSKANCSSIAGTKGREACFTGDSDKSFCICNIFFNTSTRSPICSGLVIDLLSNSCPSDRAFPLVPVAPFVPDSLVDGGRVVGMMFLVVACFLVVFYGGGTLFNRLAQGKRGTAAVPCIGGFFARNKDHMYPTEYHPLT